MAVTKKVVLLGDGAVGKTSLIRRYVHDRFDDSYVMTIGSKVSKKQLAISRKDKVTQLNLMIWDVLGREGYASLHSRTFAGVHGAILVADMTRRETLASLERYWIPTLFKVVEYVPLVFACNKSDLSGSAAFDFKEIGDMASRYNSGLRDALPRNLSTSYLTSAKAGSNVNAAFESLGRMLLSSKILDDPIKELYESVIAMGVSRQSDKSTAIGALDAILADFCEGFDDDRLAMSLVRQETVRAGIDVRSPTREGLLMIVEYLAEAELDFLGANEVHANYNRRLEWAKAVR